MEEQLFQTRNEYFHVKVAKTPEEIKALLEVGLKYVVKKDVAVPPKEKIMPKLTYKCSEISHKSKYPITCRIS